MSETRKAGSEEFKKELAEASKDELYGGVKDYGSWGDTWDKEAVQQQLKASGSYDAESELAKEFASLKKDGRSRVDDADGWRELVFDEDAKGATNYAELVNKWSAAGFDVRAIDMDKGFANSNIAVRRSQGPGTGIENPVGEIDDIPVGEGGSGGDTITNNPEVGSGTSVNAEDFLNTFINNSFNAQGGTLTNSGNITSEGDVTLDNSVTNSNTFNNGFTAEGFRLNLGDLKL